MNSQILKLPVTNTNKGAICEYESYLSLFEKSIVVEVTTFELHQKDDHQIGQVLERSIRVLVRFLVMADCLSFDLFVPSQQDIRVQFLTFCLRSNDVFDKDNVTI